MDLPLLPTQASEYNKQRTRPQFTIRSANSPLYSLTSRSGVRIPRYFSEEKRESAEEVQENERYGTHAGTDDTNKEEYTVGGHQASTGSHSVKGQCKAIETSGKTDKAITNFATETSEKHAFEGRGRTEWRRYDQLSRSKSLDFQSATRSPDLGTKADVSMLSAQTEWDINKQAGELEEQRAGVESTKGKVMSSVQAYNSASVSNVQERSPGSHMSQTLDKVSRGYSLPSRLRPQPSPGSKFTATAASFGPKGGQSILERIEKLYGSAGVGKAEDNSKIRNFSNTATTAEPLIPPQLKSYEKAEGEKFPKRFSSGENNSLSSVQRRKTFTWMPQKDISNSDSPLFPGRRRRLSGGQWQGQFQSRYTDESGDNWGKGLKEIGTRSLDRASSRSTVAAQIRATRAAGNITAESKSFIEENAPVLLKDSPGLRDKTNEFQDERRANHQEVQNETDGINGVREAADRVKDKGQLKNSSTDDVFESQAQKITLKTTEKKRFPEMLSVPSAASVKNKINQFEALSQRATGQGPMPRRALSVPIQLIRAHDGVKTSDSAKATGGLMDKNKGWNKEEEAVFKTERCSSVDEHGLRLAKKAREGTDLVENKGREHFDKYSRLKNTLEIPLNGGAQRRCTTFYIDETDFSKVSSPEKASERDMTVNNIPSSLLSNGTSAGMQKATPSGINSPVSDDDKTPTNTPNHSPFLPPTAQPEHAVPTADRYDSSSVFTQATKVLDPQSLRPFQSSSQELVSPEVMTDYQKQKRKQDIDLQAWVAGLNPDVKVWNDDGDDYKDDDDVSTQKDDDSNYDSDSGESSVTITSNMSQSDRRSFSVSLSDLRNFSGAGYESENDSDEGKSTGRRSVSLSSDVSALSCVSVIPSEELDRLLEDVRNLQDSDDVQVVVLHKEMGVGLGFSLAGGVDQNKPITVGE
ncbi:uncharacterized protein LOC113136372 isoform X2 [Mastacembelus armatus]|uniref:uncharacterized protein LOC113136372 isoform X2 n=1 Tax=Mastacembelus armatus TaxID=205130 RepID=UPI000E458F6C|nr:uncharacterized protein LOC113136372 isoform X2 [Mastacembelus armatus]